MNNLSENIKNLRNSTGAGFLDCKKALEENNNDIDKAIVFLRKKGLTKAVKKSSRDANEGAVGVYINKDKAVILEINTETDFAAKNITFLEFMDKIGNYALEFNYSNNFKLNDFLECDFENKTISEHFVDTIAKIGENIVLRRINIIIKEPDSEIFTYTHNSYKSNVGKICVLLEAKVEKFDEETKQFGKNLCMHIAASKPISLDVTDLDKELIEKEKDIQLETIKSSNKPDNIIEKILEGKMKKFYSEVTFFNQPYILDTDKDIKKIISEFSLKNKFSVSKFIIFILGS